MNATYEQAMQRAKRLHERAENQVDEYEQSCLYLAIADTLVVAAMNVWPATLHVRGIPTDVARSIAAMANSVGDGAWEGACVRGVDVDCDAPREAEARPWRIEDDEVQP